VSKLQFVWLLFLLGVIIVPTNANAASRFLSLPFEDAPVVIQAGWKYAGGSAHRGIDYELARGHPVLAAADGIAMASRQPHQTSGQSYGRFVLINQTGFSTLYAHLDSVAVKEFPPDERFNSDFLSWTMVKKGDVIGFAGDDESPTGVHLHFEVAVNSLGTYGEHVTGKTDPYAIFDLPSFYPPSGVDFTACGANPLWIPSLDTCGINDDFDDNFLDPSLWSELVPPPGFSGNVSETNQQLEITAGPGVGGTGVVSVCSVAGDFDVQVDFSLLSWPPNNAHNLRLGTTDLGEGPFGGVGINRSSFSEEYIMVFVDDAVQTPTTDTVGMLRLERTGSTLSGYFHDGIDWVLVGSGTTTTDPTRFNLDLGSGDPSAPGGVTIAFDNFRVNAGIVECPPVEPLPLPTARAWLSLAGNIAYAVGGGICEVPVCVGFFGASETSTVEAFDPLTGTWTPKSPLQIARFGLTASEVNGKIYAFGGISGPGSQPTPSVEEYNPASDAWSFKTIMLTPRWKLTSSVVNGRIYAIGGGATGNQCVPNGIVEEYDPSSDTWEGKSPMPTPRWGLASAVIAGQIYAVGGSRACPHIIVNPSSGLEVYDPSTDTWSAKTPMPTPRWDLAAAAVGGKVYAIGGWDPVSESVLETVEEYDPATDTWTTKAPMPTARTGLVAMSINDKIYAIGGFDGTTVVDIVEVYDPLTDTWL